MKSKFRLNISLCFHVSLLLICDFRLFFMQSANVDGFRLSGLDWLPGNAGCLFVANGGLPFRDRF